MSDCGSSISLRRERNTLIVAFSILRSSRTAGAPENGINPTDQHQTQVTQDKRTNRYQDEDQTFEDDKINELKEHVDFEFSGWKTQIEQPGF